MDITFFNPHLQPEADFLASFVARSQTLDYYLRQLRLLPKKQQARHHLIVAPRGYGKTSLLRRLAIAVRVEPDLTAKFIPLTFREEQHNVISLDIFWRNCLQSLLEAREDESGSESEIDELDAAWEEHAPRQTLNRDEQDGEPAWREFQALCNRLGRRPLLLIDNLDSLLAGLPPKHQWSLRGILQEQDGPMLIAAAPQFPESTHDPAAAFYDFFRLESLDKLSDQEVMRCLRTMATARGDAGKVVLNLLDKDPGRIVALNALAGGNPRTLSVLYSVLESHMSADVLSQLSAMLDTFTSWYHSRSEDLPSQARAVFDALALNWDPMTAAAVGAVTGLDTTAVSSQISRLEKAGLVEAVALNRRGKGRNGYQVAERFFNIWYLMRNGPRRTRQSIKFLAVFLQSCFSIAERRTLARTVMTDGSANSAYALGLAASLQASQLRERLLDYAEAQSSLAGTKEEYGAAIEEMRNRDYSRRRRKQPDGPARWKRDLARLDRVIERLGQASTMGEKVQVAKALVNKGNTLDQLGKAELAIELYESVVARFGDASESALREQVARALVNKGFTLGQLGHPEQEIEVYESVVARFGDTSESALREAVVRSLVNKGFTLGQLSRPERAIEVYDSVVARFGDASESALREQVARALVNKGFALGQLSRPEQEIEVYESVVARFGEASESALREQVARALVNKGSTLDQLSRPEQAIEIYDSVVARFGDASESALREQVAKALVNQGLTLRQIGRPEQAIEVYERVAARFGDASESALREQVANALVNQGLTLRQIGRHEQAIEVYERVVARFGDASESALREQVANALFNRGFALTQLGHPEQAIEAFDGVVARFGDAFELGLRKRVARALFNRGFALRQLGHLEQAIEAFESVAARLGDATEPGLLEPVARSLVNKGITLGQLGHPEQELEVYESVVARFGDATDSGLREQVARSLVNKGITLGQLGHPEQELEVYESVVARFGDATDSGLREQVASALVNKGSALAQLGHPEQAIEVYESVVARFGDATELGLREQVARARVSMGTLFTDIGRLDKAEAVLREAATAATSDMTGTAWTSLGNLLLDRIGNPDGALAAYESGLTADHTPKGQAVLHANCAYAYALHGGDLVRGRDHALQAMSDEKNISSAGRHLLGALVCLQETPGGPWPKFFAQIGLALKSDDAGLWSNYLDDLQRLIWFVIAQGEGGSLRRWMDQEQYSRRYAPLYYAITAAIDGEDQLLQINPETRHAAARIHEGIARRLRLYGQGTGRTSARKKPTALRA
jgi:tetratricopeptide (TPR) repeat protein